MYCNLKIILVFGKFSLLNKFISNEVWILRGKKNRFGLSSAPLLVSIEALIFKLCNK